MTDHQVCNARTGEVTRVAWTGPKLTVEEGLVVTQQERQLETNEATIRQQADAAIVDLRAYRDLASPTNAQTVAAVKLLCRVAIGLIRLVLRRLDSTS